MWDDYSRVAQFDRYVYGQLVSTSGTLVGPDIKISTNKARLSSVAFGGTNHLVVWIDDSNSTDVLGRFIGTDGSLGPEFTINVNSVLSDNGASTVCDTSSGNCLVVWEEEYDVLNKKWDVFSQLVSPSGTLIGPAPDLTTASGAKHFPGVSFDGINFLIVWTDFNNDTNSNFICDAGEEPCLDVYGRYIDTTGSPSGSEFAINTNPDNQVGFLTGYGGGKHLVLINVGFPINSDVYGQFVTP